MFRFISKNFILFIPNHNHNAYNFEESVTNSVRLFQTLTVESFNSDNFSSRNQDNPTVSYLNRKCGLPLDSAISASKEVAITNTQRADSVLQLFKSYNFTPPQIANLITKCSSLIQSDPDTTLKPKFEYLESMGLSKQEVVEMFLSHKCSPFAQSDLVKMEPSVSVSTLGTHGVLHSLNPHLTTVLYLKNKCGLSLDSAVLASKEITITSTQKADSVIQLFKSYDFTQSHITNLITKCPSLIQYDLKPKFEYLESLGLQKPDLTKMFTSDKCPSFILSDRDRLERNVSVLRTQGMPDSNISRLLVEHPRAFVIRNDVFQHRFQRINKMGICPKSLAFFRAIVVVIFASDEFWEKKFGIFKSIGWSDKDILVAFKMQPRCLSCSEKKIRLLMDFYLNGLGLKSSDVAKCPNILMLSLEKRLIPRCSVLNLLLSKGLLSNLYVVSALNMTKGNFEKKFVTKYLDIVPEIMSVYQGEKELPSHEGLRLKR